MAILFQDGFETLPFTGLVKVPPWTGTNGVICIVENVDPHHGTYNAKFYDVPQGGGANAYKTGLAATAAMYHRSYFKFLVLPTTANSWMDIMGTADTDWQDSVFVSIRESGGVLYWGVTVYIAGVATRTYEAVASNPTTGVYYCIEVLRDVTNSRTKLWVDEVLKIDIASAHVGNSDRIWDGITFHNNVADLACRVDCVVVAVHRIYCEVDFGGGCNPAQMAKVILGL